MSRTMLVRASLHPLPKGKQITDSFATSYLWSFIQDNFRERQTTSIFQSRGSISRSMYSSLHFANGSYSGPYWLWLVESWSRRRRRDP